jgi:hypothetical protein
MFRQKMRVANVTAVRRSACLVNGPIVRTASLIWLLSLWKVLTLHRQRIDAASNTAQTCGSCLEANALERDLRSDGADSESAGQSSRFRFMVYATSISNTACPAGEDIRGWLFHAESGDYEAAWRKLTENNPLRDVMGRL